MYFGIHGLDFSPANIRVNSVLRLSGYLDLLLPEHDLVPGGGEGQGETKRVTKPLFYLHRSTMEAIETADQTVL